MSATKVQRIIALCVLGTGATLMGCESPCDTLVTELCERFDDPQKCSEWKAIAEEAGNDSCEESLQKLDWVKRQ